jgi:hypothetical protein
MIDALAIFSEPSAWAALGTLIVLEVGRGCGGWASAWRW